MILSGNDIIIEKNVSVDYAENIKVKLENKSAVIGIIGLGYVGLPLAIRYSSAGYKVVGFDVDLVKVEKINSGQSYIEHIPSTSIEVAVQRGFTATENFKTVGSVDAIIICVPTPLSKYRDPDLSYIISTLGSIVPHLSEGQVVSLESTTYPGTTEEEILPRIQEAGFTVGKNMFLVYSPEREDPGNQKFNTQTIPKVCGGHTGKCLEVGVELYRQVIDTVVPVSSTKVAEFTKLLENIHRSVNIGLINEMKITADKMGIDIHEVIRAAATKPFGFVPYYPGPGLGGHCIPIDPFYLTWKAKEFGIHTRFIELAGEINSSMPNYVVSKITLALNSVGKSVNNSKVLILGLSYKKNIDDCRESPSIHIMEKLRELGARISYSDPHVPKFPKMREHYFDLESVALTLETLEEFDCVVVTTDHDKFDYDLIIKKSHLIVDTRGVYKKRKH